MLSKLIATNFKASFALRGAFLMQSGLMALNNLLFFVFWWVLFERFEEIRGWRIEDVAALYGLAAASYGIAAVLAGGFGDLARKIHEGELDPLLTRPRSVLVQAVAARSRPDGLGDIVSGLALVGLSGYLELSTAPLVLLCLGLGAVTFTASAVLIHSVAFWLGRVETLARQLSEFVIMFSVYPPTLFGPSLKVVMFTVLPAGFISHLPVELLRDFDVAGLGWLVGGVVAYVAVAHWVFHRGLAQYESGSRFSMHE